MKPGQKVVCIDDSPCKVCGGDTGLLKNRVYVVKDICGHRLGPAVKLIGWWSPKCFGRPEHGNSPCGSVGAYRFRLLDELKQETAKRNRDGLAVDSAKTA